jgi:uncharacterized OB-fold protein
MEKWLEGLDPVVVRQDLQVPYRYSLGATTSKFFIEIRDNRKIMGIRCPACELVYVPPRATCGRCFSQLDDWVEVGGRGTLETYTRVQYSTPAQPVPAPFYYGIIKLDGASTGLPHLVGGMKGREPRIGMRLEAVFRDERRGNMLDIAYFQPTEERGTGPTAHGPRRTAPGRKKRVQGPRKEKTGPRRKAQGAKKEKNREKAKGGKGEKGKSVKAKGKDQKAQVKRQKVFVKRRKANGKKP